MIKKNFILLICMFLTVFSSAQVELFNENKGASVLYQKSFSEKNYENFGMGFGVLLKNQIALGISYSKVDKTNSIGVEVDFLSNPNILIRYFVGFSYASISAYPSNYRSPSISGGLFKCFFPDSKFPFAFTAMLSGHLFYSDGDKLTKPDDYTVVPAIQYVQGIFSKGQIYPFVAFGASRDFENNLTYGHALFGINVKMNNIKTNNKNENEF